MNRKNPGGKQPRSKKDLAEYRKAELTASEHVYRDMARLANVTYSMAEKWMNAIRTSAACAKAFQTLTGKPAMPGQERAA